MEQHNKLPISTEVVLSFNDGVVYEAHTRNPKIEREAWDPIEIKFNTIVFYEEIAGKKVIASYREYINEAHTRKIVDNNKTPEEMKQICLEVLVGLLKEDSASSWYRNKEFVLSRPYNESVRDYFKDNIEAHVDVNSLKIKNPSKIYKD